MAEIALFGGSFDPPHLGHAFAITSVLALEPVGELWLLPAAAHAFGKPLLAFDRRLEMCEALASIFGARVSVSSIEAELSQTGELSRTVDTVAALRTHHPEHTFAWVIGSDLLTELPRWKDADRLKTLCRIIVVGRAGHASVPGVPIPDISSTEVRARLASGEGVEHLVPAAVLPLARSAYGR